MKANAPEKLFLDATSKCGDTVFTIKNNDTDIEYTRTDLIVERVAEFLYNYNQKQVLKHGAKAVLGCSEFTVNVEDFKKYIRGE